MGHPETGTGFVHWFLLGLGGGLAALLVAQFFPTIIPARAAAFKL